MDTAVDCREEVWRGDEEKGNYMVVSQRCCHCRKEILAANGPNDAHIDGYHDVQLLVQ